ncbi:MAG: stage V sporulation protein AD [Ruminococcaceae bacterium]|nr:stage V sporulation protein AD [Oscillospiraceae bacterium]
MSVIYPRKPTYILCSASVGGNRERNGQIGDLMDITSMDDRFGKDTWEEAEAEIQRLSLRKALEKGGLRESDLSCMFAGDLLNQCVASVYGLLGFNAPLFGIFGACSTVAEGLILATLAINGGAELCSVTASSHNCSAERQFRYPIEYGAIRTPTSQWTVTGGASFIVGSKCESPIAKILALCPGRMCDSGISDANNMGAAMAPAAADTFIRYFKETGEKPEDFDYIFTGDLGAEGSDLFKLIMGDNGFRYLENHRDCGLMIYSSEDKDIKSGGSGCGCSASVLSSLILPDIKRGRLKNVLFAATGALMNAATVQQGNTIPGICHLLRISSVGG